MRSYKWPLLLLGCLLAAFAVPLATSPARAAPAGDRPTLVHLFQWRWSDIARECTTFLGPEGYGGVQVSPPAEHIVLPGGGHPWWQDYQPVSYKIDRTRRGTLAEFRAMTQACENAGVKIYADVIVNHMTGQNGGGAGSAGTSIGTKYESPGLYGNADFGDCRRDITNWNDAGEIRNCELLGLADLRTGTEAVREKVADYLFRLMQNGVDGFRVDAAKHIYPADLQSVIGKVRAKASAAGLPMPYVYSEVWYEGAGEPITPQEYFASGDTKDNNGGRDYTIGLGRTTVQNGVVRANAPEPCVTVPPDLTAPSVPGGLTAVADGTTVRLTWSAATDDVAVSGYEISRVRGSGAPEVLAAAGTSYSDTRLDPRTSYTHRIRALDAAGNRSADSASVTARTGDAPPVPATSRAA
jgi:hypothetical protein